MTGVCGIFARSIKGVMRSGMGNVKAYDMSLCELFGVTLSGLGGVFDQSPKVSAVPFVLGL